MTLFATSSGASPQHVSGAGHHRLLRARCERPRRRCAAERRQEFSPSDVACHVTLRLGVIHAMEGGYHVSIGQSVTKADRQGSLNHSAMSAHCPVSGHDRAIYDAGCSSGVTIGTRAFTATMTLP